MNLLKIEVGILILKPELPKDTLTVFKAALYALVGEVGSKILAEFTIKLSKEKARELWGKDVSKYPWAEDFYQHLSSSEVTLIVLEKEIAAKKVKKGLRGSFGDLINNLNSNLKKGFSLDLIHGSDEGEGLKELGVISGSEVGILTIDYFLKVRGLRV